MPGRVSKSTQPSPNGLIGNFGQAEGRAEARLPTFSLSPAPTKNEQRELSSLFAAGNPGGPGNPMARAVGQLRSALVAAATEEGIRLIVAALIRKTKAGDIAAAR